LYVLESILGGAAAEKVLLYLQNYEQAYGREIASAFGMAQSQVQKQLLKLESGGVLVSRLAGRTRLYERNSRNVLVKPLRALLQTALECLPPTEQERYFRMCPAIRRPCEHSDPHTNPVRHVSLV
jgi:DNA-binding transcriptional ArsR family regulator